MWWPRRSAAYVPRACECGFEIWHPLVVTRFCTVGFYNDWRFPGRLIVSCTEHFDSVEDLSAAALTRFMRDVRAISSAQRLALGADRVNIAILGNQEAHVHAHLIPRVYAQEPRPEKAPWEDPRLRGPLDAVRSQQVQNLLRSALSRMSGSVPVHGGDERALADRGRVHPRRATPEHAFAWVGAGEARNGRTDNADRVDDLLAEGFGRDSS